jgi:hypothetical protein
LLPGREALGVVRAGSPFTRCQNEMISSLSMAAAIFGAFGPRFARVNRDKFFYYPSQCSCAGLSEPVVGLAFLLDCLRVA